MKGAHACQLDPMPVRVVDVVNLQGRSMCLSVQWFLLIVVMYFTALLAYLSAQRRRPRT
jgi:hypothetical protein